ncbi:MAG TPA: translocation/assembly module TamB domain-containing protein [Polyangiaceae bacterium]|nr:translocation/assembly module TamB domain-containing protein [Polyangiaceae bacterium]
MAAKHAHARRGFWRWVLLVVQWIALALGGLIVVALLSLQLRFVRNFIAKQVEGVLASTFAGRVAIERLDGLSLTGLSGARVRIFDPRGAQVLLVDDATVNVATFATLRSFLKKEGDLVIDISAVKLGYVDANLDADPDGNFKLLQAFAPKEEKTETEPSARATVIHLRKIGLQHGWVHGQPKDAPLVDTDLDRLDLSLIVGGDRTVADLATLEIDARALPQGLGLRTHLEAHYAKPAPSGRDQAGRVDLKGEISGVPFTLNGSIDGPDVLANFDVPKVTPDDGRRLSPSLALTQDVAAHGEARGHLPDLDAKVHVSLGKGVLDLAARASIAEDKKLHATLSAKKIDARALSRTAPTTNVGADATVDVVLLANGEGNGTYVIEVPSGDFGGNLVPGTRLEGGIKMSRSSEGATAIGVNGRGDIDEPGARTTVLFDFAQHGAASTVDFRVNTVAAKLDRTRIGNTMSGSATLDARGTVGLGQATTVDATLNLRASRVVSGSTRVDDGTLRAKVQGNIADPNRATVDVDFRGRGVGAGGMSFATAALAMRGSLQATEVTASLVPTSGPRVDASTWLSLDDGIGVRNTRLEAARDGVSAVLRVARVRSSGGQMRVEGVSLEGLGEPLQGEVIQTPRGLAVRATSQGLDLGKVGRLLQQKDLSGGKVGLDIDLALQPATATGHVRINLEGGNFARVKNGTAQMDAKFSGRKAEATIHAQLGEIGQIDVDDCHVEFEGNAPLGMASLEKARGRLAMDSQINLTRIKAILPRGSVPFTDIQGALHIKGSIARNSIEEAPELQFSAATRGLVLSGRGDAEDREQVNSTRVDPTPPWSLEGVDVEMVASIAKDSGGTTLQSRIFDRQGTIVSVNLNSDSMPYRHWLKAKAIDTSRLTDIPWAAEIAVPSRELKKFPAFLKTRQMGGSLAASLHFEGALAHPDLRLLVEAKDWEMPAARGMHPINAKVDAHYEEGKGAVDINLTAREKQLLGGTVELRGDLPGLPSSSKEPPAPMRASTKMRLEEFPLETLDAFSDLQLKGLVSGELTVDDVHKDARAKAQIAVRDLQVGRARFPRGNANVDFDGRALRASVRLDQTDGFLQAQAQLGMRWGADTTPTAATEEPAFVVLKANQFRAAALLPFAASVLGQLDGRINADARVDLVPGGAPKMNGNVTFERGRVQLTRVGEPMHDVKARVVFSPDGLVRLEEFEAHGSTGRMNVKGAVRLNGFQLVGARANITIPKNDPFPLDIDGQAVGEIYADISIAADVTPDRRTMNVKVDIPRLHSDLPLASSNKPQELGEADKIRVGYFRRPKQFVILPKDAEDLKDKDAPAADEAPTTTNVAIHLGDDVEVQRGTTLRIALTGDPKLELAEEPKMSGQIRLTRGQLEVQGRRFKVERGTVTFVGEPDNPQIVVSAYWDASDGTRVYADFVGPLKTGKVNLRSDPSRPQNEILALIMFGTAEGSSSTPYPTQQPDGATRAGTFAGGFATEGLSKGLDELTGLDVSAKIDTSSSANPKPEVEVQIARDISVQIAYVLGTPPPGVNPDKTFVTLDWRFKRNWSMETTFGDQGSSIVDFLWQYRY